MFQFIFSLYFLAGAFNIVQVTTAHTDDVDDDDAEAAADDADVLSTYSVLLTQVMWCTTAGGPRARTHSHTHPFDLHHLRNFHLRSVR